MTPRSRLELIQQMAPMTKKLKWLLGLAAWTLVAALVVGLVVGKVCEALHAGAAVAMLAGLMFGWPTGVLVATAYINKYDLP